MTFLLDNFKGLIQCEVHSDKKATKDILQTEVPVTISDEGGGVDSSARA